MGESVQFQVIVCFCTSCSLCGYLQKTTKRSKLYKSTNKYSTYILYTSTKSTKNDQCTNLQKYQGGHGSTPTRQHVRSWHGTTRANMDTIIPDTARHASQSNTMIPDTAWHVIFWHGHAPNTTGTWHGMTRTRLDLARPLGHDSNRKTLTFDEYVCLTNLLWMKGAPHCGG